MICGTMEDNKGLGIALLFVVSYFNCALGCPAGEYLDATSQCRPCGVGFYQPGDRDVCLMCPVGMVTLDTGSTSIDDCNVEISNTTRCPAGHHWYGSVEECRPCPLGTYNPGSNDYACLPCPLGTTTNTQAAPDKSQCIDKCAAGRERFNDNEECQACRIGMYKSHDSPHVHCVPCPYSRTTLQKGATDVSACFDRPDVVNTFNPMECPRGTTWRMDVSGCVKCSSGYYWMDGECITCPSGSTTMFAGAMYPETCIAEFLVLSANNRLLQKDEIQCPIGTEFVRTPLGCRSCPIGTFRDTISEPQCTLCPSNTTSTYEGAHKITMCDNEPVFDDVVASTINRQTARSCPLGTEWNDALRMCKACAHGTYRENDLHHSCMMCPRGFTTPIEGSISVLDCNMKMPESASNVNLFFDQTCPPGTEWSSAGPGCVTCPRGFYSSDISDFCQPCPDSFTTLTSGVKTIRECAVPMVDHIYFALTPDGCSPGYSPDVHNTTCMPCPIGTYKSAYGFDPCTSCPNNQNGLPAVTKSSAAISELQCLVDIVIESITPPSMLQTGGVLTLHIDTNATEVRADSVHTLAGVHCKLIDTWVRDGMLLCETTPARQPAEGAVVVYLQAWNELPRFVSRENLRVVRNPVVRQLQRTKVFAAGGVHVYFDVENAMSAQTTTILFYRPDSKARLTQHCQPVNESVIQCLIPDFSDWITQETRKRREASDWLYPINIGLVFDHWRFYSNLSALIPQSGKLEVEQNPVIWPFTSTINEDTIVLRQDSMITTFLVNGSRLMDGALVDDYNISVGTTQCHVVMLSTASVECSILPSDFRSLETNVKHQIKIRIGNIMYDPGFLLIKSNGIFDDSTSKVKHKDSDNSYVIILAVSLVIAACLAIVIACMCCFYNRRKSQETRKHEQADKADGWQSLRSSPTGSVRSVTSQRLPPLPVSSVFGRDRKMDNGEVTMRPLALPQANLYQTS